MTPFSEWKMISLSPKSQFEHRVGMPMPRLTIQPSPNSIASRSHICCRLSPFARSLINRYSPDAAATTPRAGRDLEQPVHQEPGGMHVVGIDGAHRQNVFLDLDHRDPGGHRHDRVEVALRVPETEIARSVR